MNKDLLGDSKQSWWSAIVVVGLALCVAGCTAATPSGDGDPAYKQGDTADGGDKPMLECPKGPVGKIDVEFGCKCVYVWSCKDISNLVFETEGGMHMKLDDLEGTEGYFCTDKAIAGVWVKAGNNKSGDGPGYGERFDSPGDLCEPDPCEFEGYKDLGGECPPEPCLKDGDGC